MTERQVRIIFGVLAVLVLAYVGAELLGGGDGGSEEELGLARAVTDSARSVRILESGGDTVRLELREDTALVNGFPADTAEVRALLAALDTARAGELVARSAANHDRLGVTEDAADRVVVGPADSPSFTFLLGDRGRGGRFVRRPDADEVYLLDGPAEIRLGQSAEAWRDRRVAAVDTARIHRLALERDGRRTTLLRGGDGWRAASGDSVAGAAVRSLLGALSDLRAAGQVPADSVIRTADFSSPTAELRATARSGDGGEPLLTLRVVRVGEDGPYLTRRDDRPHTYVLSGYQYDRLFPPREDLLP